ncbi:MAG: sulfatase [Nocardioides sp.]
MPLPSSSRGRWLTAAALAAVASLTVSGCTSGGPDHHPHRSPIGKVPRSEQPVRAPGAADKVLAGSPLQPQQLATPERPNLLMITTDDAAWEDMRFLPHVQRLMARQGVTLTNGMAPTPICVPARASLITGQYAHNHGALTISGEGGGFAAFPDEDTLPVWLQSAGYDTLFLGKYLNGYGEDGSATYVPPGWTDWRGFVDPSTYNFVKPTVNVNGRTEEHREYSTDLLSDETHDLLTDPARTKRPWYLWVNYVAPHTGGPDAPDDPSQVFPDDRHALATTTPAPEDENTFSDLDLPDKPNMFEADVSDKVLIRGTHATWSPDRRLEVREAHQQRVEALQAVHRAVQRTVATLRETGQLDNTYLVFTSDNGFVLGEHNLTGKLWYFHDIVGIPMYIRGPGLPAGLSSDTPVTNADWAPTFAALAGATPTRDVDGVDVLPWLTTKSARRVVPVEGYPVRGGTTARYTGVVVGPWTFVRAPSGRSEMYYRTVDPYELTNLRRDPRYQAQAAKLARLARKYADCAGAGCPKDFYR